MKLKLNFFLFLFLGSFIAQSQVFDSNNINLLGRWYDVNMPAEPNFDAKYNSCYGYVDSNGREYAILGSTMGTHIINVTDPNAPVQIQFIPGRRDNCVWREYKTYKNYLYAVSDDAAPNSLQIMDLSYLPDSVHLVHDSDTIFQKSHTIYIDGNKLYCGVLTTLTNQYGMAVYSLNDPVHPQFLADIETFYPLYYQVHDMFVRNDTVYASCGFEKLQIFKFDSLNNTFTKIGSLEAYPEAGYNHSSTLTQNGQYLVFADEVPAELGMKIVDVSDMSDIQLTSVFRSNQGATPHNPYLKNDKVIIAYYRDGCQIFDISNPSTPVRTGFFDTHPQNGSSYTGQPYQGAWGAYPFLPSGIILVSDMQYGLFVLDANVALGLSPRAETANVNSFNIQPNPVETSCILLGLPEGASTIQIIDISGKVAQQINPSGLKGPSVSLNLEQLPQGLYQVRVNYPDGKFYTERLVKH